ncbi:MAG: TolC family outer membrane protein [Burkholderiaceae bacterium]|nr:TolC family outer membrane protein [Burkholderiaceae bacterium]
MRQYLIASLLASSLLALNGHASNLLQTYKEALTNDAQYASARASLVAGQEKAPQGLAGLLPAVAASGSYTRLEPDYSASYKANTYGITLTQPLFNWASIQQYQQGKLSVAASEATFAQAQQDLIVRVAQAYFDVLAAQDVITFVQAQKAAISEQLASAKRNFEVGTATITDTHEAQARYDLAVSQEIAGLNDLEVKRTALQQIIGKTPGDLAPLRSGIAIASPDPARIDAWVGYAEAQNYGVLGAQLALEIAQREISRMRAGHMPTVNLVAGRNRNDYSGPGVPSSARDGITNSIGVQWTIPLFSGMGVTSKVREAIALEDKARNDLEYTRRTAAQGARQAYLGVTSGLAQVKALEAAEVSSQSALDSNKLGYEVGVRINIDVLNAQQQLYSTRKDLAKARYDAVMNGLKLKSFSGILKEDDLVRVNGLLKH